jgi:hypothetical protein
MKQAMPLALVQFRADFKEPLRRFERQQKYCLP